MTENDPAGPAEAGGPSQEELRAEERRARYMDIGNTMRERIEAIAQEMRAAGWTENAHERVGAGACPVRAAARR